VQPTLREEERENINTRMTKHSIVKPQLEKLRNRFLKKMNKLGLSETTAIKVYKEVRTQLLDSYQKGYTVGRKNND
jgi:hypothetical protein